MVQFPFLDPRGLVANAAGAATVAFRAWINEMQKRLFAAEDSVAAVSDAQALAEADIDDLEGDVADLEVLVDTLGDDIGALDTRVDALEAGAGFYDGVVSGLPDPATTPRATRAFVTDATSTTFAAIVVGGGANQVPVYCDTVDWRIG